MTVSPIVLVIGISLALAAVSFGIIQPSLGRQLIDWFTSLLWGQPKSDAPEPVEESLSGTPSPSSEALPSGSGEPSGSSNSLIQSISPPSSE